MAWQSQLHAFLSIPISFKRTGQATLLIALTFIVHLLFFFGTHHVYYTSPNIGSVPKAYRPAIKDPPARRAILFVIDGLRAHTIFKNKMESAPYLRDVVFNQGAWGVSYARSPTLSRPGHMSLLSGVNEYVDGLTRGRWFNPFDSIFNRSRNAWLFGEDEIVAMFADMKRKGHVNLWYYPPTLNDFSMGDPRKLDQIIFDQLDKFFHNASETRNMDRRLANKTGLVFMTHLLGVDTFSHTRKTSGEGLRRVIASVDKGIKRTVRLFDKYFNHDGRTTYILSSDHGMADWNAHGAGNTLEETMTPVIAWGAGIRRPIRSKSPADSWNMKNDWSIPYKSVEIAQVDICPLMAAVLGVDFPSHSIGRVPLDLLDVNDRSKSKIMRANAFQMLEQFLELQRQVKAKSLSILFSEFPPLTKSKVAERIGEAILMANEGNERDAIAAYDLLLNDSYAGIYYYHRYHNVFDRFTLSGILLLLMLCRAMSSLQVNNAAEKENFSFRELTFFFVLIASQFVMSIFESRSMLQLFFWTIMAYLAWSVYRNLNRLRNISFSFNECIEKCLYLCGLELLVWSYFYRGLIVVAVIVQMVCQVMIIGKEKRNSIYLRLFLLGSLTSAVFPLLPTVGLYTNIHLVSLGSIISVIIFAYFLIKFVRESTYSRAARTLLAIQLILILVACVVHFRTHSSIRRGDGLPSGTILLTRSLLIATLITVLLAGFVSSISFILVSIWLGIMVAFTLFSMAFETLFISVLFLTLFIWMKMHTEPLLPFNVLFNSDTTTTTKRTIDTNNLLIHSDNNLNRKDFVHIYTYTVFLLLSCYGNGNFPSISSYDPHWVLCFQAVYDLAVMGIVMFLRNMLPVLLITNPLLFILADVNFLQIYRIAVLFVEFIAAHFFFHLHYTEDPLFFATMVNQFTIAMAFCGMVSICFVFSRLLTTHRI